MKSRRELCGRCAQLMKQSGRTLILIHRGMEQKIFCMECFRPRYGGIYDEVVG